MKTEGGQQSNELYLKATIEDEFNPENTTEQGRLKQFLQEYLELKEGDIERISLIKIKDLPQKYHTQREFLNDKRLENVTVAIVPDDLWAKGSQPSESSAENQLILIKQSYFETQENPDEIAWICHEMAHYQKFLDSQTTGQYQDDMQKFAFENLKTEYTYPNNRVEQHAFTKQFQFLKTQGKSKEEILTMLGQYYENADMPFFQKLLDGVYK